MTFFLRHLMLAIRERRDVAVPLGLWVLVTAIATITGPFQTFDLLPPGHRLIYWGFVAALSIVLSVAHLEIFAQRPAIWRLLGWLPFSAMLGALLHVLNRAVFDHWTGWPDYIWLFGIVLAICFLTELASELLMPNAVERPPRPDPVAALMERLPLEHRGRLIRIEAQDHYLSVVTSAGTAMILMRMGDAESILAGVDGIRVHRSHWVMQTEVSRHFRHEGRDLLEMSDGSTVPISRGARSLVQRAGLIPLRAA